MKKILIVEDNKEIAEIERDFLAINGYEVVIACDGEQGLTQALTKKFDLIILDLMLPKIDGYEICRRIRNEIDIPILMVTARSEELDKLRGLGLGADDYISKPFSPTELVARVRANLAQYARLTKNAETKNTDIMVGDITLKLESHQAFFKGSEIELKNKEYELLAFMMSNLNIVFSKEHLYERIWGMDAIGDLKTVAVHINRLRYKIEDDFQNPVYLQTVWGVGYKFKA